MVRAKHLVRLLQSVYKVLGLSQRVAFFKEDRHDGLLLIFACRRRLDHIDAKLDGFLLRPDLLCFALVLISSVAAFLLKRHHREVLSGQHLAMNRLLNLQLLLLIVDSLQLSGYIGGVIFKKFDYLVLEEHGLRCE